MRIIKKAPETAPTSNIRLTNSKKRTIIIIRCSELFRQSVNFAYLFILLKINKALSRGVRAPDGRLPQYDNYPQVSKAQRVRSVVNDEHVTFTHDRDKIGLTIAIDKGYPASARRTIYQFRWLNQLLSSIKAANRLGTSVHAIIPNIIIRLGRIQQTTIIATVGDFLLRVKMPKTAHNFSSITLFINCETKCGLLTH